MYTLTHKVGHFIFPATVQLSHAKLIRDLIVEQISTEKQGRLIRSDQDAKDYAYDNADQVLLRAATKLTFVPN